MTRRHRLLAAFLICISAIMLYAFIGKQSMIDDNAINELFIDITNKWISAKALLQTKTGSEITRSKLDLIARDYISQICFLANAKRIPIPIWWKYNMLSVTNNKVNNNIYFSFYIDYDNDEDIVSHADISSSLITKDKVLCTIKPDGVYADGKKLLSDIHVSEFSLSGDIYFSKIIIEGVHYYIVYDVFASSAVLCVISGKETYITNININQSQGTVSASGLHRCELLSTSDMQKIVIIGASPVVSYMFVVNRKGDMVGRFIAE